MGKRKERRHAGAGRRVKLDLFAEPSGDMSGALAEEIEGGVDTKLEAVLPKSPSSSGHPPANPLSLLGQYSDDDMEELSSDDNQHTAQAENDEQIKPHNKEAEELNVASSEEHLPKNNELYVEKDVASKDELTHEKQLEPLQQVSIPSSTDIHATEDDAKLCWKMVLHEESNSYYYWNTVTGETSWEVPPDLAQGQTSSLAEDNSHRDVYTSITTASANEVTYSLFAAGSEIAQPRDEYKGDESQLFNAYHQENATLGSFSSYVPPNEPIGNIYIHGGVTNIQDGTALADLPSHLVKRGESLLDKLRSLKGSEEHPNEKHGWTSKYIYEIEIRLFDLKSLLSCGPSLASFWVHSETQLKRLEDAINSEIGSYMESELKDEINSANNEGSEATQENRNAESDDVQLAGLKPIEEEKTSNEESVVANQNAEVEGEEDMDVDMEVEDITTRSDDDWIPPPPPDNEEIPPPPPDDPPESESESFCPPPPTSYPDTVQTLTYPTTASYNLTYPDPNYSYYGVTLNPTQPLYYEAVPTSDSTLVYYVQDQATEPPSSYQPQMGSFQNPNLDAYEAVRVGAETINPSISASASHASTSTSSVAVSTLPTVSDSSAVAAAKPQTKAPRAKKRTVAVASSLRSNKKVSSLVNKWKAAKEEMEEAEEDEAENALLILEKKRQREIEEWRAQQIASGEARENPNFQPLGGDWREIVKRKRAKTEKETVVEKKQSNLTESSNGLPPGWQAYWDESSKKVYYGNTITSETTWTRPT